jgi:hypothetical protein
MKWTVWIVVGHGASAMGATVNSRWLTTVVVGDVSRADVEDEGVYFQGQSDDVRVGD